MTHIGSLNENPVHAAIKHWYADDGDLVEETVDGFVIDLVRDDLLIEVQTRNFSAMRRKLDHLLDAHRIRIVHPIPAVRWIVRHDERGREVFRRRSPKRGIAADLCAELVSFPSLLSHPNLEIEVLLVEDEEHRVPDQTKGWRRRGYVIDERHLLGIHERETFSSPEDLLRLLPVGLPDPFTTADIAVGLGRTRHLAQEVAYCLRESGAVEVVGRDAGGIRYQRP